MRGSWLLAFAFAISPAVAGASDLRIHLDGDRPVSRHRSQYRCDAQGTGLGLPPGVFTVEYINIGTNSLAVVPIHGASQIFANVISGSGARYASGSLIWWTGRSITLSSDSPAGKTSSTCEEIK